MVSNDLVIQLKLEQYLEDQGFFDFDSPGRHYIFNGAGRNRTQMSSLIGMFCENGMLTEHAKFVKLNISSHVAYKRMVDRYHQNLQNGTLRKEEEGEYEDVLKKFRRRIGDWHKTRDGIFETMALNLHGHESSIVDINAGLDLAEVCLDLVRQVGLPEGPMIDVLVNAGLLSGMITDPSGTQEISPDYTSVAVQ